VYTELDARFAGQVVVRRQPHVKRGKAGKRDAGGRRA